MSAIARITASVALLSAGLVAVSGGVYAAGPGPRNTPTGRVVSQQGDTGKKASEAPPDVAAAPLEVFADIEKAWVEKDVDGILSHFGRQKVWISVEGTGPSGGEFSRNQSYYLLKDLFKYTITRKFEFVQFRKLDDDGNATFAVAERQFQRTDDGRLFKDKIYVSLHLEGDNDEQRWVVDEIKSIR